MTDLELTRAVERRRRQDDQRRFQEGEGGRHDAPVPDLRPLPRPRGVKKARMAVGGLVLTAGAAALSWEVLWQHHASLALGVSAFGTALTLAVTMGGFSAGALLSGRVLARLAIPPTRLYGLLELVIGLAGLLLAPGFSVVTRLDAGMYSLWPSLAPAVHIGSIVAVILVPAMAMGATVPILGLVARGTGQSLALLYALNTLGAAAGTLLVAFVAMPALGVSGTTLLVAAVDVCVFVACMALPVPLAAGPDAGPGANPEPQDAASRPPVRPIGRGTPSLWAHVAVFVTGFATFGLEVAWFRSLRSSFLSTTDSFAVMLAAVLLALGLAARLASRFGRAAADGPGGGTTPWPAEYGPARTLAASGVVVVAFTPVIERFDLMAGFSIGPRVLTLFAMSFWATAPAVLLLGVTLPALLDRARTPTVWGRLYALNTAGGIAGAIVTAWMLLPAVGFARAAWALGAIAAATGLAGIVGRLRWIGAAALVGVLVLSASLESSVGRSRIQGRVAAREYRVHRFSEGADATVSVIEYRNGNRALVIDGFQAASEMRLNHYMDWMGRLPMLVHPAPRNALVICFGTGQTANGVRREGASSVQVAEINAAVLEMAPFFPTNEGVLDDPAVSVVVMDGRAWLRRTERTYDVITLEPMPPNFAGVNALYSREFYALVEARLNEGGVVAQWVPFHLITPATSRAIAQTFRRAFPDAFLWLDPVTPTGILIGTRGGAGGAPSFPGLARPAIGRDLSDEAVREGVLLPPAQLARYVDGAPVITDDNQFLAYGDEALTFWRTGADVLGPNMETLEVLTGRRLPRVR